MIGNVCPLDFKADIETLYNRWLKASGHPGALRAMKELRRSCATAVKQRTHPNAQQRLDIVNAVCQNHPPSNS